jgi:hypothetical protein
MLLYSCESWDGLFLKVEEVDDVEKKNAEGKVTVNVCDWGTWPWAYV